MRRDFLQERIIGFKHRISDDTGSVQYVPHGTL